MKYQENILPSGRRGKPTRDLIGERSGKLLVKECIEKPSGHNHRGVWLCTCDCGNSINALGKTLTRTKFGRKSCGCARKEINAKANHKRRNYDAEIAKQWNSHKYQCLRRGLTYLERDKWLTIVTQPCYYCGTIDKRTPLTSPTWVKEHSYCSEEELNRYTKYLNGVDRLDSTKDYIIDNIVSCCAQCNYMKIHYTEDEFFNKISLIHNRHSYRDVSLESLLCN